MGLTETLKHFASKLTLLVVEDEKALNGELVNMLSIFFSSVDFAYDGDEGLKKYNELSPDIVLTDIQMPKMNGIKMSKKIKLINKKQHVVVLSAHSDTKFMMELMDIGINQFILKPFDRHTLLYKLLKIAENIAGEDGVNECHKYRKDIIDEMAKLEVNNEEYDFSKDETKLVLKIFKDDVPELIRLCGEFSGDIQKLYLDGLTIDTRDSMVQVMHGYINIFSKLDKMLLITEVLMQLIYILDDLDVDSMSKDKQNKLKILELVNNDIMKFLQTVFVYKDTVDIYHLEDSLENLISHLRSDLLSDETVEDESFDDLFKC